LAESLLRGLLAMWHLEVLAVRAGVCQLPARRIPTTRVLLTAVASSASAAEGTLALLCAWGCWLTAVEAAQRKERHRLMWESRASRLVKVGPAMASFTAWCSLVVARQRRQREEAAAEEMSNLAKSHADGVVKACLLRERLIMTWWYFRVWSEMLSWWTPMEQLEIMEGSEIRQRFIILAWFRAVPRLRQRRQALARQRSATHVLIVALAHHTLRVFVRVWRDQALLGPLCPPTHAAKFTLLTDEDALALAAEDEVVGPAPEIMADTVLSRWLERDAECATGWLACAVLLAWHHAAAATDGGTGQQLPPVVTPQLDCPKYMLHDMRSRSMPQSVLERLCAEYAAMNPMTRLVFEVWCVLID